MSLMKYLAQINRWSVKLTLLFHHTNCNKKRLVFLSFATFLSTVQVSLAQSNSRQPISTREFTVSDCEGGCPINPSVNSAFLHDSILDIKISTYINCIAKNHKVITYSFYNDTLFFEIPSFQRTSDTTYSTHKGDFSKLPPLPTIRTTTSSADCDCLYELSVIIRNCAVLPKVVLINNKLAVFKE